MEVRVHHCKHILPEIITAIQNHPLQDQLIFDTTQDFGCQTILDQTEICPAGEVET